MVHPQTTCPATPTLTATPAHRRICPPLFRCTRHPVPHGLSAPSPVDLKPAILMYAMRLPACTSTYPHSVFGHKSSSLWHWSVDSVRPTTVIVQHPEAVRRGRQEAGPGAFRPIEGLFDPQDYKELAFRLKDETMQANA